MKKRIAIAVIIIAAVALGLMNVINAEDNVKITPRYYLENDKITINHDKYFDPSFIPGDVPPPNNQTPPPEPID